MNGRLILRLLVMLIVIGAVITVLALKARHAEVSPSEGELTPAASAPVPKLLDLGSDTCIPCRRMAPILASMRTEFAGRFDVQFIDVRKMPAAAKAHEITLIPTQIFFDADGNELFRHQGFFSRSDILQAWQRLGYDFGAESDDPAAGAAPSDAAGEREAMRLSSIAADSSEPTAERDRTIIAYYFHRTLRCETCLMIEDRTQSVLHRQFAEAIESGKLAWQPINFDEPEHEHFADDFDLFTSSLVLVEQVDGSVSRWVLLGDTWTLIDTGEPFERYIVSNTRAYLDDQPAPAEDKSDE